jgi:hypothetical protein
MKQRTFVHQAKYTNDLMKKFNIVEFKSVSTPMSIATSLDSDEDDEVVDQREYMSMIDSLKTKWTMVYRLRLKPTGGRRCGTRVKINQLDLRGSMLG